MTFAAFAAAPAVTPSRGAWGAHQTALRARSAPFTGTRGRARARVGRGRRVSWMQMKIGIFFSTTTGNTTEIAGMMKQILGDSADEPQEIDEVEGEEFLRYDTYIVGAPTWNTDADVERSGTSWDDFLYGDLKEMDMSGKTVGVFGLGDAAGYGDNFCDAIEEMHDCFAERGARMVGYVDPGYITFDESKSVRDGKLLGLAVDYVNGEEDEIVDYVSKWCDQVRAECKVAAAA